MTGSGLRPLDLPCGEQGKLPTAKAFKLAERDKHMSEQEKPASSCRSSTSGVTPTSSSRCSTSTSPRQDWEEVAELVKKAIRAKNLESYRNGQAAGPRRYATQPRRAVPVRSV